MEKVNLKVPIEDIENILGTVTSPSIVLSEIIKNSIDSNANNITINIFTKQKKQLIISDDGDGFTLENVKKLGNISESDKKVDSNLFRKDGYYFAGSKGLGILSLFSISDKFIMETERDKKRYKILWSKGLSSFTYEELPCKNKNGTQILMENIDEECLKILTDENELNKLKHISIQNYITCCLSTKNVSFFIDNNLCNELKVSHIDKLRNKFKGSIKFAYEYTSNTLRFQYFSDNNIVNKKEILIDLNKDISISDILVKNYNLSQVTYKGEPCKYLDFSLESFNGEIFVTEKKKDSELVNFGEGVRVFVNQFAMYGYLDRENDWLNLSVFSLQRKNTRYKPHNVFGYVHFDQLNENKSNLKISNERAYFIENGAFKKFQEIMKNLITTIAFNIDVAERNNLFKINIGEDCLKNGNTNGEQECSSENNTANTEQEGHSVSNVANTQEEAYLANNVTNIQQENYSENTINNIQQEGSSMNNPANNQIEKHKNSLKISKKGQNQAEKREPISHLDINAISYITNEDSNITNPSDTSTSLDTDLNPIIGIDKKPKFNFFNTSNIVKSPNKIEIEYDELIIQLKKLDYKKFYLIYGIAFRAILEDVSKRYLNARGIKLCGDFGQNIRLMTDDILQVVKDSSIIDVLDKSHIENIIGGYHAFRNFFEVTGSDFYNNGKQGIKATKLNSFVHAPRWMEIEEAENMANNIILPLYIISKEIISRMKK